MSRETKKELGDEVVRLAREQEAATDAFDEIASRKLGINRTDMRALNTIDVHGPLTAGQLAELSGLTTAAVTAVLDRLEKVGYARRVRDENDRRQVFVELTPLLRERSDEIWGPIVPEAAKLFESMSVEELKAVIEYHRAGRDLNRRHAERVRQIEFED
jgi:DNA-binding MarR family transcriptional regulator